MSVYVAPSKIVVKEVSEDFAYENADDGCEVEESEYFIGKAVATKDFGLGEEYVGGGVNTDRPGEDEEAGQVLTAKADQG